MEKRGVSDYYYVGSSLRYLIDATPGDSVHGEDVVLWNIQSLIKHFDDLELKVTANATVELREFAEKLRATPQDAVLSVEQARELSDLMGFVEHTLQAEIELFSAYVVTPKVVDVNKLVDDVPSLFSPNVFTALPEIARYDFTEAGKCIAFERPTAAAFHLLRGTEAVLRYFYEQLVKRERIKSRLWGPLVEHLRNRPTTSKYASLYANLDNIRQHYRNPTQHPELIYNIHEVQDLWSLCIAAVNHMVRVLVAEQK